MNEEKNMLRNEILNIRKNISQDEIKEKSKKIFDNLVHMDIYKKSSLIMTYVDYNNEVQTVDFIKYALKDAKTIAVPCVVSENGQDFLVASKISDFEKDLQSGKYGILEPSKDNLNLVMPEDIDLIIVPGVSFDLRKNRIGYGKGYFDKFLKQLKPLSIKCAVAFELQIRESVPIDEHDIKMNVIITEDRVIE